MRRKKKSKDNVYRTQDKKMFFRLNTVENLGRGKDYFKKSEIKSRVSESLMGKAIYKFLR